MVVSEGVGLGGRGRRVDGPAEEERGVWFREEGLWSGLGKLSSGWWLW